jgi:hypothetical protein
MAPTAALTLTLPLLLGLAAGQQPSPTGPGAGPWTVSSPEAEGLDFTALAVAEGLIHEYVGERDAFIVVKGGHIVFERYRDGRLSSTATQQYSATKSLCSSLFGVAMGQGWASPSDLVAARSAASAPTHPPI